jgi:hypothetical protein
VAVPGHAGAADADWITDRAAAAEQVVKLAPMGDDDD